MALIQDGNSLKLIFDYPNNPLEIKEIYNGALGKIEWFRYHLSNDYSNIFIMLVTDSGYYLIFSCEETNSDYYTIKIEEDVKKIISTAIDVCVKFEPLIFRVLASDMHLYEIRAEDGKFVSSVGYELDDGLRNLPDIKKIYHNTITDTLIFFSGSTIKSISFMIGYPITDGLDDDKGFKELALFYESFKIDYVKHDNVMTYTPGRRIIKPHNLRIEKIIVTKAGRIFFLDSEKNLWARQPHRCILLSSNVDNVCKSLLNDVVYAKTNEGLKRICSSGLRNEELIIKSNEIRMSIESTYDLNQ